MSDKSSAGESCEKTGSLSGFEDEHDEKDGAKRPAATAMTATTAPLRESAPPSCLQRSESLEPISIALNGGGVSPQNLRALHVVTDDAHATMMSLHIGNGNHNQGGHQSVVAEPVYFDEISGIEEDYMEQQRALQDKREQRKKLFIFSMIFLTLVLLGMVGITVAVLREEDAEDSPLNVANSTSPTRAPRSPAPSRSPAPTTSFAPSAAPSCTASFSLVSSLNISGDDFSNFEVSPHGSVAIMTHSEAEFFFARPEEYLFFDTFDVSAGQMVRTPVLQDHPINIQHIQLSANGKRLAVAVYGYGSDPFDFGGALLVYQRTSSGEWLLLYQQLTGGGVPGSVFTTAMDAAGITFGVVAGVIGSDSPSFARVYRVQIGSGTLMTKGSDFVSSSITNDALIALSADGSRVFLYTTNDQVQVYDYSDQEWRETGAPITWGDSTTIKRIEVSDDGRTFLLVPEVINPTCYIFQQNIDSDSWEMASLDWTSVGSVDNSRLYYQRGSLAGDGRSVALSVSYYREQNSIIATNEVYLYQDRHEGWLLVDFVELPFGNDFLGHSLDQTGSKLVIATQEEMQTYDLACEEPGFINVPSASPAPTLTPSPTESPTCVDTFKLAFTGSIAQPDNVFEAHRRNDSQYVLSADGSTVVVGSLDSTNEVSWIETYALNGNNVTTTLNPSRFEDGLTSFAVSGDGQMLVAGFRLHIVAADSGTGAVPFNKGGSLVLFSLGSGVWDEVSTVETGGGIEGAVFHVALSNDGLTTAFVAGQESRNDSFFVSVYGLSSGGILLQIGNTLIEPWLDSNTTVGLVQDRLFISSNDGLIRTYDLLDGIWQPVGGDIEHFGANLFLSSTDDSVVVTASPFHDIQVFDFGSTGSWQALDVTVLNGFVSSDDLVGVSVGRGEILVTESVVPSSDQNATATKPVAKRFVRGLDDAYYLSSETEILVQHNDGGATPIVHGTQLMDNDDMGFVLDKQVSVYTRDACATV